MKKTTIYLADDHSIVREGLKRLIEAEADMTVIGEAGDGAEVLEHVRCMRPDVVVLDLSMPVMNGLEVARLLRAHCPEAKLLVLTVHENTAYAREMLEAGVLGYMLKRAAAAELVSAIRTVARGDMHADMHVASRLVGSAGGATENTTGGVNNLSARELEVLRLIARGYSNKEVAARLRVSVKTVETYKVRSMEKLRLRNRVEIVRHADRLGWLRDE